MEISFIKNFTSRSSDQVQGLGPGANTNLQKNIFFFSLNGYVYAPEDNLLICFTYNFNDLDQLDVT